MKFGLLTLCLFFQPLDQLWQLMRDWMEILRVEFNETESCDIEPCSPLVTDSNILQDNIPNIPTSNILSGNILNDNILTLKTNEVKGEGMLHNDADGANETNRLDIVLDRQESVKVLKLMPQRVCCVIQAFYLVCSASDTTTEG